jgi:membrane-associated tyrosine/threonine-specific cdc2-inhibitory kinase
MIKTMIKVDGSGLITVMKQQRYSLDNKTVAGKENYRPTFYTPQLPKPLFGTIISTLPKKDRRDSSGYLKPETPTKKVFNRDLEHKIRSVGDVYLSPLPTNTPSKTTGGTTNIAMGYLNNCISPIVHQSQFAEDNNNISMEEPSSLLDLFQQCSSSSPVQHVNSEASMLLDEEDGINISKEDPLDLMDAPPEIIWNTPFAHFLDFEYFKQLEETATSNEYIIPNGKDDNNYFDAHFSILENLGHGSSARVYKVGNYEDHHHPKFYAVKITKFPFIGYKDRLRKIEEISVMIKVGKSHHCVELIKSWEQHGYLYILTELCVGTLDDYMTSHYDDLYDEERIWEISIDIALGIRHIHERDIVHSDIKPSNILIGSDGHLKLGDFGLAFDVYLGKLFCEDREEGDRNYMALEVLEGNIGKPADIFSFGISLLEVASLCQIPSCDEPWRKLRIPDLSDVPWDENTSSELMTFISLAMQPIERRPDIKQLLLILNKFKMSRL